MLLLTLTLSKKRRPLTYIKGVDPNGIFTLKREILINLILTKLKNRALVVLKGPAGVGKSSIMNLVANLIESSTDHGFSQSQYTFMEREGLTPLAQLNIALLKIGLSDPNSLPRILLCDDIQNVPALFWEKLHTDTEWFTKHNVRILAATTRRCSSDPASPVLSTECTINFDLLRFTEDEFDTFSALYLPYTNHIKDLPKEDLDMVLNAAREQCAGHLYAFQCTIDSLDEFCSRTENKRPDRLITLLLSKAFLDSVYTRIWIPRADNFSITERNTLQRAMVRDSEKLLSVDLQITLMRMYFLQDSSQVLFDRSWSEVKKEATFPLAARRLYSMMFDCRGDESFPVDGILDLAVKTLERFKGLDLQQAATASPTEFPKEGPLQQMFLRSMTSLLPATTEVVAEISAILPDRGDQKRGELDFYVNSEYHYGIELMREGSSFKEHKERFQSPKPGNNNQGKYFTPLIKEFLIVDFRGPNFKAKKHDEFRLIVSFSKDYTSCVLQHGAKQVGTIQFT